jgi:glycosyltransferase involved in cell wall biosynthesis
MKRVPDSILVFSHLRWDFVFQRPQHLLSRCAKEFRVYFFEEPIADVEPGDSSYLSTNEPVDGVQVLVPHLPKDSPRKESIQRQKELLKSFMSDKSLSDFIFWYYTPMALEFSGELIPDVIVYDCMDELSAFKNAPAELTNLENELLSRADLVFTGGHSLYEAKKQQHPHIYPFPSSIDKEHFGQARRVKEQPADQAGIGGVKLGFYGVIDERFDCKLISDAARMRPDWNFILLGPVVKINPAILPQSDNIHYLGCKSYDELPAYLSGWDIAMIPFLLNESTRFISPTKTPEYLAAGIPVISTPITDVVRPYGTLKLVEIAGDATRFVQAAERTLRAPRERWLGNVDTFLADKSWDKTWADMCDLIRRSITRKISVSLSA